MPAKFIIRFDDITPKMSWDKFVLLETVLNQHEIKPIVGVVPDCKDIKLDTGQIKQNFWEEIKIFYDKGWTIAQHGYTHEYHTNDSGILGINKNSEFSGLAYDVQLKKLSLGKELLVKKGVWQPIFMAPSHSFDENTLKALSALGFMYITDGYGCYPYKIGDLLAIPQLFSKPHHFGFGIYTICLHVNSMSDDNIDKMILFIEENTKNIISFSDACKVSTPVWSKLLRNPTKLFLKLTRYARRLFI